MIIDSVNGMREGLKQLLTNESRLELAFLIGSRANHTDHKQSDWDFALQWKKNLPIMEQLTATEVLRYKLAKQCGTTDDNIDLINIPNAGLAICEVIANEGIILKGDNTLALSHFLLRTWHQVEAFYWDEIYAT